MKHIFGFIIALFSLSSTCAGEGLEGHHQLLVVTTNNWETHQGVLQRFERAENRNWVAVGSSIPVVIGKTGLAWGIGLHAKQGLSSDPVKVEGDGKAPAGIFALGTSFGFATSKEMAHLKVDYLQLTKEIEAVDDPVSQYYNQIVCRNDVSIDWNSSEKMGDEPLYQFGMVVDHNFPNPQKGAGSAIFLHIWRGEASRGTAGCTSMSLENLTEVLSWLEAKKAPVLVQLPKGVYSEVKDSWELPELSPSSSIK